MPTKRPSVSTFTAPSVISPYDPATNPTQAVLYWLTRDIVRGVFSPMERLRVEFLTKFYRVGHSPVREAIILLSSTGLVVHEHQKGYRAAPVSVDDYDDLVNIYKRIYLLALGMAIDNGGEAWEEKVVVQLHRSLKVPKVLLDGEPQAREMWQRAYGALHYKILAGCGSPLLLELYTNLGARMERYVNLFADLESDRHRDHHAEHKAIVDALIARDKVKAFALVEKFFAGGQPIRVSIIETLKRGDHAPGEGKKRGPKEVRRRRVRKRQAA